MFLEAVVQDHSLDSRGFTYFVPEHLHGQIRRGCVVEVPFGDELVPAVVTEADAPPPDRSEAKAVVAVLVPEPVVHPYQIEAAYALAKRHFIFLHTALSFFLPTPVLRRFLKTGKGYGEGVPSSPPSQHRPWGFSEDRGSAPESDGITKGQPEDPARFLDAVSALSASEIDGTEPGTPSPKPTLYYDRDGLGAAKLFWTRYPAEPGTVLVLPSDAAVAAFVRETALDPETLLIHEDSLTEAKDFRLRLSVAVRERPFLVWSRKLCSYNLAAYPNVFYFEDSLFSEARHKFFHSYDHAFLFEEFTRAYPFRLSVSSFVPSVRLMALTLRGDWTLENA